MLKKIALLGLAVALGVALYAPALAQCSIEGSVGVPNAGDHAALGTTAAFRVYSAAAAGACPGPLTTGCMNGNTGLTGDPACKDARCSSQFFDLGDQYFQATEDVGAYAGNANNQPILAMYDGEVNAGTPGSIAYYAVGGVLASNCTSSAPSGTAIAPGCPPGGANCMEQLDSRFARTTPMSDTAAAYGAGAHEIRSLGGFSPVPNVRPSVTGGTVNLAWDAPDTFAAAMQAGPGGPFPAGLTPAVLGVRVWKITLPAAGGTCPVPPLSTDPGWVSLGTVNNPTTTSSDAAPAAGQCAYYALTVRAIGPGGTSEVETGARAGANSSPGGFVGVRSQGVGGPNTSILIASVNARYAGRGTVNVSWTTGVEGGVQGFFVARGTTPAGPFTRVSSQIAPRGDNSQYSFNDKAKAGVGRVVYYAIEAIGADGQVISSGPTAVTIPVPRKGGLQ